jgi:glc operon protein GlcG
LIASGFLLNQRPLPSKKADAILSHVERGDSTKQTEIVREEAMSRLSILAGAICAGIVLGSVAYAQQPAAQQPATQPMPPAPPPIGAPVTNAQAKKAVAAAVANAVTRPYLLVFAVVDPSGSLVYFEKMDGAPYSSTDVAIGKARTAATFERPTEVFFNQMEGGHPFVATLAPYVTASRGGIPLIVDGKLIGAIGVSGSPNPAFDISAAQAGVDAIK